jgi:mannose-1-phosphate guanylyltransferase
VSREAHPKPFTKMVDGEHLLLETLQRALATGASKVLAVAKRDYYFITRDQYAALKPPANMEFTYKRCPKRAVETAWARKPAMRDNLTHMLYEV